MLCISCNNTPTLNSAMKILVSPFSLSYQIKMLKSVAPLSRTWTLFDFCVSCVSAMSFCACRKHFVCNQNSEGITAYFSLLCFTDGEGITPILFQEVMLHWYRTWKLVPLSRGSDVNHRMESVWQYQHKSHGFVIAHASLQV